MAHDHDGDGDDILRAMALLRRLGATSNEWHRSPAHEGFTVNQALVLHHLVVHGDATPSDLAEWMHVTRGSVTPTVKRLEDLGLLTRRIDDEDGRKQWLSATAEAHEITPEVEREILHPMHDAFAAWSARKLRTFIACMEELLDGGAMAVRP